jgi:hypothetical protein
MGTRYSVKGVEGLGVGRGMIFGRGAGCRRGNSAGFCPDRSSITINTNYINKLRLVVQEA